MGTAAKIGVVLLVIFLLLGALGYTYYQHYTSLQYEFSGLRLEDIEIRPDWRTVYYALTGNLVEAALSTVQSITLDLDVTIRNPGFLPVIIPPFDYSLYGNNIRIGEGRQTNSITIGANSGEVITIQQVITVASLQPLISSVILAGGQLDVTAEAQVQMGPLPFYWPLRVSKSINVYQAASQKLQTFLLGEPRIGATLVLDRPLSRIPEGDLIIFTGELTSGDTGNGIAGAKIKIVDSDFDFDDQMASGVTGSDGRFSISWVAKTMDPFDRSVEMIAQFDGDGVHGKTESPRFDIEILTLQDLKVDSLLVLDRPPDKALEGTSITFTGRLIRADTGETISNAVIEIMDSDVAGDDVITSATTNIEGRFRATWSAETKDPFDSTIEVYARFTGTSELQGSRSPPESHYLITVEKPSLIKTRLVVDPLPTTVTEGSILVFTGRLVRADTGQGISGATIKIVDGDFDFDDVMATGVTQNNGEFRIDWTAKTMDPTDRTVEVMVQFDGDSTYESTETSIHVIDVRTREVIKVLTLLTLGRPPAVVKEGTSVVLTGTLVRADTREGIPGVRIEIYDSDFDADDLIVSTTTNERGEFRISWSATPKDPLDRSVEIYAIFSGSGGFLASRSPEDGHFKIQVEPSTILATILTLDQPPGIVQEGSVLVFTGRLVEADTGIPIVGAVVKVRESDFDFDDDIATGTTDSDGRFSISWVARTMDPFDRTVEVYAEFQGSSNYAKSRNPTDNHYTIRIE